MASAKIHGRCHSSRIDARPRQSRWRALGDCECRRLNRASGLGGPSLYRSASRGQGPRLGYCRPVWISLLPVDGSPPSGFDALGRDEPPRFVRSDGDTNLEVADWWSTRDGFCRVVRAVDRFDVLRVGPILAYAYDRSSVCRALHSQITPVRLIDDAGFAKLVVNVKKGHW